MTTSIGDRGDRERYRTPDAVPGSTRPSWSSRSVARSRTRRGRRLRGRPPPRPLSLSTPITTMTTISTTTGAAPSPAQGRRPSPDGHLPKHGWQGCTLVERQSCVDYQGPQCHAVVQAAQWCQARRGRLVCCGRRQGDISFSFSRAGWRFTTSSLVASASAASAATAGTAAAKDVLRIHHGAVDQTTITARLPPEVMKRI